MKVYSKNYYLPGLGKTIGGEKVTAAIDKELDNRLSAVGKKAADFHKEVKEKKKA